MSLNGNSRAYWEARAQALRDRDDTHVCWRVGRTDMMTYGGPNCQYQHFAYGPAGKDKVFQGGVMGGLKKAVLYAERMNRAIDRTAAKRS